MKHVLIFTILYFSKFVIGSEYFTRSDVTPFFPNWFAIIKLDISFNVKHDQINLMDILEKTTELTDTTIVKHTKSGNQFRIIELIAQNEKGIKSFAYHYNTLMEESGEYHSVVLFVEKNHQIKHFGSKLTQHKVVSQTNHVKKGLISSQNKHFTLDHKSSLFCRFASGPGPLGFQVGSFSWAI